MTVRALAARGSGGAHATCNLQPRLGPVGGGGLGGSSVRIWWRATPPPPPPLVWTGTRYFVNEKNKKRDARRDNAVKNSGWMSGQEHHITGQSGVHIRQGAPVPAERTARAGLGCPGSGILTAVHAWEGAPGGRPAAAGLGGPGESPRTGAPRVRLSTRGERGTARALRGNGPGVARSRA